MLIFVKEGNSKLVLLGKATRKLDGYAPSPPTERNFLPFLLFIGTLPMFVMGYFEPNYPVNRFLVNLQVGILYDEASLQSVLDMTSDWTAEEREMLRNKVICPYSLNIIMHFVSNL